MEGKETYNTLQLVLSLLLLIAVVSNIGAFENTGQWIISIILSLIYLRLNIK